MGSPLAKKRKFLGGFLEPSKYKTDAQLNDEWDLLKWVGSVAPRDKDGVLDIDETLDILNSLTPEEKDAIIMMGKIGG